MGLKYYTGMGKNVTDYVEGLERKVRDLEQELETFKRDRRPVEAPEPKAMPETKGTIMENMEPEVSVTVEEKPKRKRSKKKVNASS